MLFAVITAAIIHGHSCTNYSICFGVYLPRFLSREPRESLRRRRRQLPGSWRRPEFGRIGRSTTAFSQKKRKQCPYGALFLPGKSPVAGLSSSVPSAVKREPWQGQSHECSARFHFNAQPKWGHTFSECVSQFTTASEPFTSSLGLRMLREGSNTSAQSFVLPVRRSQTARADTMETVMVYI